MDDRLASHLKLSAVPHEDFVRETYRLVLRRSPEPEVAAELVRGLAAGLLSRAALLRDLVLSPEAERVRALDDGVALAAAARAAGERPAGLTAPPGSDERLIEIPWVLARYRGERRVLDVGYANAEPAYLGALLAAAPAAPTGVDLAEAEVPGLERVVADVRKLPFAARSFDVVLCVSTLEHVGSDNRVYGLAEAYDGAGIPAALSELKRVLRRRGRLLVTVPTGESEDRAWFIQREPRSWRDLFIQAGFAVFEQELYELRDEGWRSVETLTPGLRYAERGPAASAVLCVELRPGRLRHAVRSRARTLLRRTD